MASKTKCPACGAVVTATPDEAGSFLCNQCGVRLKAASAPGSSRPATTPDAPQVAPHPPRPGPPPAPSPLAPGRTSPAETLAILNELRALRGRVDEMLRGQAQILAALRSPGARAERQQPESEPVSMLSAEPAEDVPAPTAPRTRRRRKTVLLLDDDEATRRAALAALEGAQVPVRAVAEGNAALAAIAEEKPDVIVMELGTGGAMAGKDVINMIKATMEWVDIPVVLYTRVPMDGQKEARTVHGGDEWVPKGPGSPEQLVLKVIQIFQKASYN